MSVILFIFKLIGIILLALLGIILLLVLFVLFIPVRYRVSGQIEDEITIHAKVNWLLHLISFRADYQEEEFVSGLYIFGIRMKTKKKNALEDEEFEDEEKDVDKADDAVATSEMREDSDAKEAESVLHADEPVTETVDAEHVHGVHHPTSLFQQIASKIQSFFLSIQSRIRRIFELLHRIKEGIPLLLKNISTLKEIITDEANKNVLFAVVTELKYLLGHFKFRKFATDLKFSTGDPATTGQALGILSMFPILYQYQVGITPDFESEEFYIKGVFEIKGRIRLVHFITSFVRLWKKREVRVFVKKLLDR